MADLKNWVLRTPAIPMSSASERHQLNSNTTSVYSAVPNVSVQWKESSPKGLLQDASFLEKSTRYYQSISSVGRSFLLQEQPCISRSYGVILANLNKFSLVKVYKFCPYYLIRLLLVFSILICAFVSSHQSLVEWTKELCRQTPRAQAVIESLMANLLYLFTLATPAVAAFIGQRAPLADTTTPTISVPSSLPTDASRNIDPSFPGYAFEIASLVEYATGEEAPDFMICRRSLRALWL